MADSKSEQEPSIEEILASIRQIISDDDDAPAPKTAEKPAPVPEPAPEPIPEPEPDIEDEEEKDDILDLTSEMQEEPEDIDVPDEDLDTEFEIALAEINETLVQDEDLPVDDEPEEIMAVDDDFDDIISKEVQSAALASMAKLASGMPVSKPVSTPRHYDGVTLEDIVRDLLHPMLREWMDDNLPPMVERIVQKEMEKLSRRVAD